MIAIKKKAIKKRFVVYEFGLAYWVVDFIDKLKSYFRAEYSWVAQGELCEGKYQLRIDTCLKCPELIETDDPVGHCGACGCGTTNPR